LDCSTPVFTEGSAHGDIHLFRNLVLDEEAEVIALVLVGVLLLGVGNLADYRPFENISFVDHLN